MSPRLELRNALLAVLLLAAPHTAGAEIYTWRDASGREHFTSDLQRVPARHRRQAVDGARGGEDASVNYHPETRPKPPEAKPAETAPPAKRGEAVGYDCEALRKLARKQLKQIAKKERVVERREDSVSDIASSIYSEHMRKKSLAKAEAELAELRDDYERWRTLHHRRGAPAGCLR